MTKWGGALPLALLWGLPLVLSLGSCIAGGADPEAWRDLLAHPQLWPALTLSLFTGLASSLAALVCTLIITAGLRGTQWWNRLPGMAAAGLALPHLAFAIGFGFLVMPSGLIARLLVGGVQPPHWITAQDPLGLTLTAALALKEIPFLLTVSWMALSRGDWAKALDGQCRAARSLGHGAGSVWLRIVQPQLLAQLRWPLVIVFVYGATVVDMAQVLGPTQPPTLALVIWHDLNNVDLAVNQRGLAGTLLLTLVLATVPGIAHVSSRLAGRGLRPRLAAGPSGLGVPRSLAALISAMAIVVFAAALLVLLLMSMVPRWPYPALVPPAFDSAAWTTLLNASAPLWLSLGLAAGTSLSAVLLAVLWFETQHETRDRWLIGLALLALAVPQLAVAGGQYRLFLTLGAQGTLAGLFLAHLVPVLAYVVIVLAGPYRGFDTRFTKVSHALGIAGPTGWLRLKMPLLKAPLLTAGAVGLTVSILQFVPAQLMAAGRWSTLPMEAVTLSSGGDRALTAVFALALALPPLVVFAAAFRLGRPRWP